jgi:hypothetical protein
VLVGLALGVVAYFITRRSRFERSRAAARARTARVKWRLDSETMDVMTAASKLVGELGGGELAERPSLAGRARALRSLPQPARRDPSAPRAWVRSRSGDARAIALHRLAHARRVRVGRREATRRARHRLVDRGPWRSKALSVTRALEAKMSRRHYRSWPSAARSSRSTRVATVRARGVGSQTTMRSSSP